MREALRELRHLGFWIAFFRLHLGLFLFGAAVAVMLEARIGVDPWSTLHEGLSLRTGLSFGRISQIIGAGLIAWSWWAFRVQPGLGTVFNMLLVGPWVDLLRVQTLVPWMAGGIAGVLQFLVGILLLGLATAVYLGARLGAGPRDGFVMGLSRRVEKSLRKTRIGVEVVVLALGAVLGGPIGLGTVLFALLMGPTMQSSLKLFLVPHDPSPLRASDRSRHASRSSGEALPVPPGESG